MQIHGIPVNLKLNSTVLMIASFVISVVAGLIFGFAGVGRGVYVRSCCSCWHFLSSF